MRAPKPLFTPTPTLTKQPTPKPFQASFFSNNKTNNNMKNVTAIAIALLFVFATSGCVMKEYTCVCTDVNTGDTLSVNTVEGTSNNDASDECDDKESFAYVGDHCDIVQ